MVVAGATLVGIMVSEITRRIQIDSAESPMIPVAGIAALLFLFHPFVAIQGVRIEVYALQTFLSLLVAKFVLLGLFGFLASKPSHNNTNKKPRLAGRNPRGVAEEKRYL